MESYIASCLYKLKDYGSAAAVPLFFGTNFHQKLLNSIGRIASNNSANGSCMGTLIWDNGAPRLVTATHCLAGHRRLGVSNLLEFDDYWPELTFSTLSGDNFKLMVNEDVRGYQFVDGNDIVLLDLAPGARRFSEKDLFGKARAVGIWQPLYIFALNPFLFSVANNTDRKPIPLDTVSVSFDPLCRVHAAIGSHLYHRCQDEKGMSGSSLFVIENGEARVAAVISTDNEASEYTIPQCDVNTVGAENIAVMLPTISVSPY